jgi:cbb3-type cytochrome oxidase subunit 3
MGRFMLWLILAFLGAVAYFAWRGRRERLKEAARELLKKAAQGQTHSAPKNSATPVAVEDMRACPQCGDYVPAGAKNCGKLGCPY